MSSQNANHVVQIMIIGGPATGKTDLLLSFLSSHFIDCGFATFSIDYRFNKLSINKIDIKLKIWDTPGNEKFRFINKSYYKSMDAFILTYDITEIDSFECIPEFLKDVRSMCSESSIFLVGLKSDLEDRRSVTIKEASIFARKENLMFAEASSKNGTNVEEIFNDIAINVMNRFHSAEIPEKFYRLKDWNISQPFKLLKEKEKKQIEQNFLQIVNEREEKLKKLQEEKLRKLQEEKQILRIRDGQC